MWWDVAAEAKTEFEDWHTHEHMPERLAIPGFLRGSRWIAASGEPSYFVLYEARTFATVTAGPYLERLNDPTPWSRKMMPQHRNMVRSLCRVRASFGAGLGCFIATVRFAPKPRKGALLAKTLSEVLSRLPAREGLSGAHLLQSEPMGRPQTAEQKIRGNDARADWVLLVSSYDRDALATLLGEELASPALEARGAVPGTVAASYTLSYAMTDRDVR